MFKHLITSRRRPAPRVIRLPDPQPRMRWY